MVLWWVATQERRSITQRVFEVPLQVIDHAVDADKRMVTGIPKHVKVTLSGQIDRVESLSADRISADVEVGDRTAGSFQARPLVRLPNQTELVSVEPEQVSGAIETVVSRTVRVEGMVAAVPTNEWARWMVTPSLVVAHGTNQDLDRVVRVITAPVALGAGTERTVDLLPLDIRGIPVGGVTFSPNRVILSRVDSGELPIGTFAIHLQRPPQGWLVRSVQFTPQTIRVLGLPASSKVSVEAEVPLRVGKYEAPATPKLPPGAVGLDLITATLDVQKR